MPSCSSPKKSSMRHGACATQTGVKQLTSASRQKMARAILSDAGVPFGTGHNLGQMASALPPNPPSRSKLNALDKHSPAATRYRYPGPTGRLSTPPSPDQIKADIAELADLLEEAKQLLKRA